LTLIFLLFIMVHLSKSIYYYYYYYYYYLYN
jgi:hypothetical protein